MVESYDKNFQMLRDSVSRIFDEIDFQDDRPMIKEIRDFSLSLWSALVAINYNGCDANELTREAIDRANRLIEAIHKVDSYDAITS